MKSWKNIPLRELGIKSHGCLSNKVEFYHRRGVGAQIQSSLTQVAAAGARQTVYTPVSLTDTSVFPTRDFWKRSYFENAYANISQIRWSPQIAVSHLTSHWNFMFVFCGVGIGISSYRSLSTSQGAHFHCCQCPTSILLALAFPFTYAKHQTFLQGWEHLPFCLRDFLASGITWKSGIKASLKIGE